MTAQRSAYRPTINRIKSVSGRCLRPLVAAFLALLIAIGNVAPAFAQCASQARSHETGSLAAAVATARHLWQHTARLSSRP